MFGALPTWLVLLVGLGGPALALLGVWVGHWATRTGARELDRWRRREETMRMLRWAAEHASSADEQQSRMGVAALDALGASELLQPEDRDLVDTVLTALLDDPLQGYAPGSEIDVVDDEPFDQESGTQERAPDEPPSSSERR